VYSVISVIIDSLPGNTKNRESTRSSTSRVRSVYSWAASFWCVLSKRICSAKCQNDLFSQREHLKENRFDMLHMKDSERDSLWENIFSLREHIGLFQSLSESFKEDTGLSFFFFSRFLSLLLAYIGLFICIQPYVEAYLWLSDGGKVYIMWNMSKSFSSRASSREHIGLFQRIHSSLFFLFSPLLLAYTGLLFCVQTVFRGLPLTRMAGRFTLCETCQNNSL